ncbi:senecionine N-oxygenase-like [Chelonus insularis]|uniref:senecionine N-oxygenase-like n=1 Tax=Chelonus insularis TaxID=460826 RepID=UPI00158966E0|nr:senecionine N-oxygenase-like [Chelonus insularis]
MRVAVIGAGGAGLAAVRHCVAFLKSSDQKYGKITEVVCYEKTDKVGGTWVYVPETGVDHYGLPIHSSMYESLRTNLPKEVMGYPDFPIPNHTDKSYLTRTEILNFLNQYCDHFQLRPYIQFLHNVECVEPSSDLETKNNQLSQSVRKWIVTVKDLKKNILKRETFDGVMICNGHYFEPNVPTIEGQSKFQGDQLHSHDYRVPDIFINKNVIVIGAGPSGMDLALEISNKAKQVILSHHYPDPIHTIFPENVIQKGDVVKFEETEVIFSDDSKEKADVIFYCTGYKYSFPFLKKNCGVKVDSNMVTPLWKHLLSVENPTLAFIGLPFYVCAFSMFDLQVQFVLKFWFNEKKLPSKNEMLTDEVMELKRKMEKGLGKKHFHMMGPEQGKYYDDLANIAGITPLPPVLTKLHNESSMRFLDDLVHYREDHYKIVDDFNFIQLN